MASNFTGTNTEKIDKLIEAVIELRTTLRLGFAVIWVGFPLMVGLSTYLVVQSFGTFAKFDRLNDRMDMTNSKIDRLSDQMVMVSREYARLSERLDKLDHPIRP